MENEVGKLTEKETQKKYYFIDNGLLNLFLMNSETSLLENMVAVELCRRFGKENVFFLNAEKEIDFIVFWFLGEQMLLVVLGNNSGLFWAKNKHQVPYKKQKAIRSNNNKCHLRPNDRFGLNLGSLTPRNARHKIVDKRSGVAVSAERAL